MEKERQSFNLTIDFIKKRKKREKKSFSLAVLFFDCDYLEKWSYFSSIASRCWMQRFHCESHSQQATEIGSKWVDFGFFFFLLLLPFPLSSLRRCTFLFHSLRNPVLHAGYGVKGCGMHVCNDSAVCGWI